MNPSQYHCILQKLDSVLVSFDEYTADLSDDDRRLQHTLRVLRSQVLKAESGHPFPFQVTSKGIVRNTGTNESPSEELSALSSPSDSSAAAPPRIKVLIVDDNDSVRAIARIMFDTRSNVVVVGEACNGRDAVDLANKHQPDVIVMDVNMPVLDGLAATQQVLAANPKTRVLMFSANSDGASVRRAIAIGAAGYISKPASREKLLRAVEDVYAGHTVFPKEESEPHHALS